MTLALDIKAYRSAASAGRVVTVSKSNISFHGWSGCGYVITNPATGDGAYMISGGENGGLTTFDKVAIALLFSAVFLALASLAVIFGGSAILVAALLGGFIASWILYICGVQVMDEAEIAFNYFADFVTSLFFIGMILLISGPLGLSVLFTKVVLGFAITVTLISTTLLTLRLLIKATGYCDIVMGES